jgi:hypothetical protein
MGVGVTQPASIATEASRNITMNDPRSMTAMADWVPAVSRFGLADQMKGR